MKTHICPKAGRGACGGGGGASCLHREAHEHSHVCEVTNVFCPACVETGAVPPQPQDEDRWHQRFSPWTKRYKTVRQLTALL